MERSRPEQRPPDEGAGVSERPPDIQVSETRCPYCHDGIARGVAPAVCAACHAMHHAECYAEHGACAACGAKAPESARQLATAAEVVVETPAGSVEDARAEARERSVQAEVGAALAELKLFLADCRFINGGLWPWILLPFLWPLLWWGYRHETQAAAAKAARIRDMHLAYGLTPDREALRVLEQAEGSAS